jgi:heat shock protein HslJ
MKKILIIGFIIILIGSGCKKESPANQSPLLKTKWILSFIQNTKSHSTTYFPVDAPRKIKIVFTDSLNVFSFTGICNGGGGTYSYSSSTGAVSITNLSCTKIACKYDEWEGYTIQNLDSAFSYKINGVNLIINSNGGYNLYFTTF